jgi:hypothetical protein
MLPLLQQMLLNSEGREEISSLPIFLLYFEKGGIIMAEEKKFLDYEGVKHLWSKVNMQDYPNNEMLVDVINAIDETKANKEDIPFIDDTFSIENAAADAKAVGQAFDNFNQAISDDIMQKIYPIGSIYLSVNSLNPFELFGFGTWE